MTLHHSSELDERGPARPTRKAVRPLDRPSAQPASEAPLARAIASVARGGTLSTDEAAAAMAAVMDGVGTAAQLGALLGMLRVRGETAEELTGFALAMRARVVPVAAPEGTIDTCGTGGDGAATFNVSTAAGLVAAAAGVPVAKHGNRAVTSRSGSADVLEALGIPIEHDAASAAAALRREGFCFLFAPRFHPAMRHAAPIRRELGIATCFNLLGPLTNPAAARRQVVGVADPRAASLVAETLHRLGTERAFVIHGDGIDELPLDGSGVILDVRPEGIERRTVDAEALGLRPRQTRALAGGTPAENARMLEAVMRGRPGPARDAVVLNAAAAFVVAGVEDGLRGGVERARATIADGSVTDLLERLRRAP